MKIFERERTIPRAVKGVLDELKVIERSIKARSRNQGHSSLQSGMTLIFEVKCLASIL